ncbi:Pyridine nucleotide-disulfide oxidoreductase [Ruminococcaceae bacterium BL-6]|nr:Pyridine nucleotide-disulfide oxidoreductase [Ruminococcaceae bacterium BL-6]
MYDLIVIGGGPAGLAAARAAFDAGSRRILVIERDHELGGILNQCIHNGFGLHYFHEELTGPEYAGRFIRMLENTGIEVLTDAMVLEITPEKQVTIVSRKNGYQVLSARAVVLCMGCRERTRGAIGTPGRRPAGIFTAGAAQYYVNIMGYMVGRRVLIVGSGDIGLIMARRLTLEGAKVLACIEIMPYSSGLNRNIVQCLQDYQIPLYLSHTVTEIKGDARVEGAVVSKVDENRRVIPRTEMSFDCDTVLFSVGLIPENELTRRAGIEMDPRTGGAVVYENRETSVPGIFACGNALHVHDLVDFVTEESRLAGTEAAKAPRPRAPERELLLRAGDGVSYTVPQKIRPGRVEKSTGVFFRVRRVYGKSIIRVTGGGEMVSEFRRERLAPGEMERIVLPSALLNRARDSLELSIEEEKS